MVFASVIPKPDEEDAMASIVYEVKRASKQFHPLPDDRVEDVVLACSLLPAPFA